MDLQLNKTGHLKNALAVMLLLVMQAFPATVHAQQQGDIEKALADNKPELANTLVQQQINFYYKAGNADSLNNYIFYVGKIAQQKTNAEQGIKEVGLLMEKIKKMSPKAATLRQMYIEAGEFYGFTGKNNLAYKANQEALRYTLLMPDKKPRDIGLVQSNMGTYAQRMGDLNLSQTHHREALKNFLSDPKVNFESLYISYNSMGGTMWNGSKLDSAIYYFDKAIEALAKTPRIPQNQYYRVAIVQNNLSAIYGMRGKTTEAIGAMKSCIVNVKKFLASNESSQKKNKAISFQFEATDNLAGIYKELGDFKQAQELLEYSYQQKQKNLDKDAPGIFISQILLGQLYYAMKEHDKAERFLNDGLRRIALTDGSNVLWEADGCNTLALLYDARKNVDRAAYYYEKADSLYEEASQGDYDNIYLDFLRNAALFYAENSMQDKALKKANKGYNYVIKTEGSGNLLAFYQLLNLAEVYFKSGNYSKALAYSNQGLKTVNLAMRSGSNLLDSVKISLKKPKAILMKVKSEYALLQERNVVNLNTMLKELNEALNILEKRKSIIQDGEDIVLLMADHSDLLEFVKKITLDLYNITGNTQYADQLVSLHESGIYNRIRARLDKNAAVQFNRLPPGMAGKEKDLKAAMVNALEGDGTHDQKMQAYLQSVDNWNGFLQQLRTEQPRYYKMRYASIFKSIKEIQPELPPQTSIVRYFFVDKRLMALVMDKEQKQLFELQGVPSIEKNITALSAWSMDAKKTGTILYSLYQQLWAPLADKVRYNKVIIIPDGILYNLNFELLTPSPITRYEEFVTKSLLTKLTISYQYSLFLTGQRTGQSIPGQNFVAFAPGFSDQIKNDYRMARKDSVDMDNAYLSLLPQPFTISLAAKTQQLLGGDAYMYDESTLRSFTDHAGMNKIIHIGTHAESDNIHPEFSRLIFAKNPAGNGEKNSLYLFDIYNCDLTSNLTVLTACESGKPGYQDGEGMLSLAHAFNYAGSESIITGLWKIDEQVSARIMDLFYNNLLAGMAKDEALRKAKLAYLATSGGRTLSPAYWAGLVLIGDTSPVHIEQAVIKPWMIFLLIGLIILVGYFIVKRMRTTNLEGLNKIT